MHNGLTKYVSEETPITLIAEAWRLLADENDPSGKTEDVELINNNGRYIDPEWCKMAVRTIKGYAENNPRPTCWPWKLPLFDRFPWVD